MTTTPAAAPTSGEHSLSIGDLARSTGVNAATIRMWEQRHGFPEAVRALGGHRRYSPATVDLIGQVQRRREAGLKLEMAIAEARLATAPAAPSVFAEMRRKHPHLERHRLRKSTLLALSWALEDECAARAERPVLFGAFQEQRFWNPSRSRWNELARVARHCLVMAEFTEPADADERPTRVPLDAETPMRREWNVVVDAVDLPAMLAAWELPGQSEVPDRHRLFEAVWTVDPRAVRDASRVCARVASDLGVEEAAPLLYELADEAPAAPLDPAGATTLFNRVVAYVDRLGA